MCQRRYLRRLQRVLAVLQKREGIVDFALALDKTESIAPYPPLFFFLLSIFSSPFSLYQPSTWTCPNALLVAFRLGWLRGFIFRRIWGWGLPYWRPPLSAAPWRGIRLGLVGLYTICHPRERRPRLGYTTTVLTEDKASPLNAKASAPSYPNTLGSSKS